MTAAVGFVTYLWHYLIARLLYDQLVRPLIHGRASALLFVVFVGLVAFLIGRLTRRGEAAGARSATGRRR